MSSPSTEADGFRGGGWCDLTNVGDRGGESSSSAPMQRKKRTRSRAICQISIQKSFISNMRIARGNIVRKMTSKICIIRTPHLQLSKALSSKMVACWKEQNKIALLCKAICWFLRAYTWITYVRNLITDYLLADSWLLQVLKDNKVRSCSLQLVSCKTFLCIEDGKRESVITIRNCFI